MTGECPGTRALNFLGTGNMSARLLAMLVVLSASPFYHAAGQSALTVTGDIEIVRTGLEGDLKIDSNGTSGRGVQWIVDAVPGCGFAADLYRRPADGHFYVSNNGCSNLTGVYLADGATSWSSTSDERLKYDIEPVTGILEKIRNIRVIEFNRAALGIDPDSGAVFVGFSRPARTASGTPIKHEIGSVAQDWLEYFPQLVDEPKGEFTYYGLAYDRIGIIAIGAIKELEARVAELERQLEEARR